METVTNLTECPGTFQCPPDPTDAPRRREARVCPALKVLFPPVVCTHRFDSQFGVSSMSGKKQITGSHFLLAVSLGK